VLARQDLRTAPDLPFTGVLPPVAAPVCRRSGGRSQRATVRRALLLSRVVLLVLAPGRGTEQAATLKR
jgi:ABC-type uncharacterized transport system ATPase subunit